jgi:hypothetical protein
VNFNYAKLGPDFATQFESPAFTQATQSITQYLTTVCGIHPSTPATP